MLTLNPNSPMLRGWIYCVLTVFVISTCPALGWIGVALAQGSQNLTRPEYLYSNGEYDQALSVLNQMIQEDELTDEALRDAWIIKGRCFVQLDQQPQAYDAFCGALKIDPTWVADEYLFTDIEHGLINSAIDNGCAEVTIEKSGLEPTISTPKEAGGSFFTKPLFLVGTAVVGVLAFILLSGDDEETITTTDELDDFPGTP